LSKLLSFAIPYIQDIVVFALNTGLRIGGILSLTWESVDLEKNFLTVFADPQTIFRFRGYRKQTRFCGPRPKNPEPDALSR
jgi:integrase